MVSYCTFSTEITSIPGTARADVDYQPLTFLTFTSSDRVCAQVQVIGDDVIEEDETFVLQITPGQDITIGNPSNTTITIIDDDGKSHFLCAKFIFTTLCSLRLTARDFSDDSSFLSVRNYSVNQWRMLLNKATNDSVLSNHLALGRPGPWAQSILPYIIIFSRQAT